MTDIRSLESEKQALLKMSVDHFNFEEFFKSVDNILKTIETTAEDIQFSINEISKTEKEAIAAAKEQPEEYWVNDPYFVAYNAVDLIRNRVYDILAQMNWYIEFQKIVIDKAREVIAKLKNVSEIAVKAKVQDDAYKTSFDIAERFMKMNIEHLKSITEKQNEVLKELIISKIKTSETQYKPLEEKIEEQPATVVSKKEYVCQECGESFDAPIRLAIHVRKHKKEES